MLSSGGSTDLKINNSFSLDKECEMKAVETEVQIMKQCGYKLPIPWHWVFPNLKNLILYGINGDVGMQPWKVKK